VCVCCACVDLRSLFIDFSVDKTELIGDRAGEHDLPSFSKLDPCIHMHVCMYANRPLTATVILFFSDFSVDKTELIGDRAGEHDLFFFSKLDPCIQIYVCMYVCMCLMCVCVCCVCADLRSLSIDFSVDKTELIGDRAGEHDLPSFSGLPIGAIMCYGSKMKGLLQDAAYGIELTNTRTGKEVPPSCITRVNPRVSPSCIVAVPPSCIAGLTIAV